MREYLEEEEEIEVLAEEEMEETGAEFEPASEETEEVVVLAEDEKDAITGGGTWVKNPVYYGAYSNTCYKQKCEETFWIALTSVTKVTVTSWGPASKITYSGRRVTVTRKSGKLGTVKMTLYGSNNKYVKYTVYFK